MTFILDIEKNRKDILRLRKQTNSSTGGGDSSESLTSFGEFLVLDEIATYADIPTAVAASAGSPSGNYMAMVNGNFCMIAQRGVAQSMAALDPLFNMPIIFKDENGDTQLENLEKIVLDNTIPNAPAPGAVLFTVFQLGYWNITIGTEVLVGNSYPFAIANEGQANPSQYLNFPASTLDFNAANGVVTKGTGHTNPTLTVPDISSVYSGGHFPINRKPVFDIVNLGTSPLTIVAGSGVTINTALANLTVPQYEKRQLTSVGTNSYVLTT